MIAVCMYNQ